MGAHSFAAERFLSPLDLIRSEHDRQLALYDRLDELANDEQLRPVSKEAETLIVFLTEDLPLHGKDEEEDLFRLLKLRCRPVDGFDGILEQLEFEHSLDRVLAHHIVIDLEAIADRRTLENPIRIFMNLRTFVETQRRHLAWENAVVLPLARKRLSPKDLEEMGRNMAARRAIVYPAR